jgi:hypothetical protein
MDKILMSDCGETLTVEKDYLIKVPPCQNIIIEMGADVTKAAHKFSHPNIVTSIKRIYEFKHYRKNGSKFWTSKAGVSHYIIVPKNQIQICLEKGYSYVKAEINGVIVHFNVCGGTSDTGWADYLSPSMSISVNHKIRDMKKIAEVAIKDVTLEEFILSIKSDIETSDIDQWEKMAKRASKNLKDGIKNLVAYIEKGNSFEAVLKKGFTQDKIALEKVYRRGKWVKIDAAQKEYRSDKGRVSCFIGQYLKIKPSQIDWVSTIDLFEKSKVIS